MDTSRAASWVGTAASVATLVALAAPYVLVAEPGTGLGVYYTAGLFGAAGVAFFALLAVVAFLSGEYGQASPEIAAGVVLTVGLVMFGLAVVWAVSVPSEVVFSFPAAWMGWHRWAVVALVALVPTSGAAYAATVVRR